MRLNLPFERLSWVFDRDDMAGVYHTWDRAARGRTVAERRLAPTMATTLDHALVTYQYVEITACLTPMRGVSAADSA
jgi:hypothetical protein